MATKKKVNVTRRSVSSRQVNKNSRTNIKRRKRKRRLNKRFVKMLMILFIILFLLIFLIAKRHAISLWRKGYTSEERKILLQLDKDELKDYLKLDKALDISTWNEYANKNHFYDYILYQKKVPGVNEEQAIQYVDNLYDLYPTLEELGYTKDFFRKHMSDFRYEDINTIAKKSYSYETVSKYLKVKGCQISDLSRYIESGLEPITAVLSITYPFIDSSIDTDVTYKIVDPKKLDVLIKYGFTLDASYEPEDLTPLQLPLSPDIGSAYLRKDAADALTKMAEDAKESNLFIGVRSAYRSYADQEETYNYYISMYGFYYAIQLVSPPGSSEHQLGLGVDLTSQSVIDGTYGTFDQSAEYPWVIENCYKYGFILRYPEDKTYLTGAMNEPWHFRYVGVKAATEMHNNNWTLEEYIMNHGFDYDLVRN